MAKSDKPKHEPHSDARVVMLRPMIVTAGGSFSVAPIQAARLVMAGNPKPILEGLPGYAPIIIKLDWPDMSTPSMTVADWKWLTARIRALRRPLHVSCAMGHGRTGTCLGLLAHFWGQMPRSADPVQWVRDHYCQDAIETESQIAYLERMTGRRSTCKPKAPAMGPVGGQGWKFDDEYGAPYGGPRVSGKVRTDKPFRSFPDNDASRALATGQYGKGPLGAADWHEGTRRDPVKVRFCGATDKGILCPKPAREGSALCDRHWMEMHGTDTAPTTEGA